MRAWIIVCTALAWIAVACGTATAPAPATESPSPTPTPRVIIDTLSDGQGKSLFFPRQPPTQGERVAMTALLIGDLALVDGCLRVRSLYGGDSLLPIWPPEFRLSVGDETLRVLDGSGQVVARAGEEVYMGGGEGSSDSVPADVLQRLPADCGAPYWIVGTGVRPNLRRDSDLFSLEVISTTQRSFFLLHKKPALDEWVAGDAPLTGKLVLYADQRCPRLVSEDGLVDSLPLWPPEYGARLREGQVEIVAGSGQVVATVGEAVRLAGGPIPGDWESERYRRLQAELPGDCCGPYWIVQE